MSERTDPRGSPAAPPPPRPAHLAALYQEMILDHYRRPRNRGTLPEPSTSVSLRNPLCGDEIDVHVHLEDGRVAEVRFGGRGCSISQASASIMTELVKGQNVAEVGAIGERFMAMLRGNSDAAKDPALGDLRALSGVANFPARVKCALLAWEALARALERPAR